MSSRSFFSSLLIFSVIVSTSSFVGCSTGTASPASEDQEFVPECAFDAACNDGDPCTADACVSGMCANLPIEGCSDEPVGECQSDTACDDAVACTFDWCNSEFNCEHWNQCSGGQACDLVTGTCSGCASSANCDDYNSCTVDSCQSGTCANDSISCDDGVACTEDWCDPTSGCQSQENCPDEKVCDYITGECLIDNDLSDSLETLLAQQSNPDAAIETLAQAIEDQFTQTPDIEQALERIAESFEEVLSTDEGLEQLDQLSGSLHGSLFVADFDGVERIPTLASTGRLALDDPDFANRLLLLTGDDETVILYINGIRVLFADFLVDFLALSKRIKESVMFSGVTLAGSYNYSHREHCVAESEPGNWLDHIFSAVDGWICDITHKYISDTVITVFSNLGVPQVEDRDNMAFVVRSFLEQKKKIIVVAHSDGNHITRDVLKLLKEDDDPDNKNLIYSVGVVQVGSPVSASGMPVASEKHSDFICLKDDGVALLGLQGALGWVGCEAASSQLKQSHQNYLGLVDTSFHDLKMVELGNVSNAVQAMLDEACTGECLSNDNGHNGHAFVKEYLNGKQSRTAILNAIENIQSELHTPDNVEEAALVGSGGADFNQSSGSFNIAISPTDEEGEFIGQSLSEASFDLLNVVLIEPSLVGPPLPLEASVTGVSVEPPTAGQSITAVLIYDSSGSMSGSDPGFVGRRAAGTAFFDLLTGDDEVAVIDFGAGTSGGLTVSRLLQDFTSDRALLDASLYSLEDAGGTPLYESVLDGLSLLHLRLGSGGAIVVLTDGFADSSNKLPLAVEQAQAQMTPVYTVGLGSSIAYEELSSLAQDTGGAFAEATDASALAWAFEGIGAGVKNGKVTVFAHCSYSDAIQTPSPGTYILQGTLQTTTDILCLYTDFSFTVQVEGGN